MVELNIIVIFGILFAIFGIVSNLKVDNIKPRYCGNVDNNLIRNKRYFVKPFGGHAKKSISYKITQYSRYLIPKEVDDVFSRAFNIWTNHTDLQFFQKKPDEPADIDIKFLVAGEPFDPGFDGEGGILGHALTHFLHFDDDEKWRTKDEGEGVSLYLVAIHEVGHSLGLGHSDEEASIMFDTHMSDEEYNYRLHEDDVLGIQEIYGEKSIKPIFNLNLCEDPTFDTMFNTPDGKTYIFKKDKYYEIRGTLVVDGPKFISEKWVGLPDSIDGAFTQNGKTFFFKGGQYWRFKGDQMDDGYPQRLNLWYSEIPNEINDVTVWKDGKVYFFRRSKVYRMDEFNEHYTTIEEKFINNEWKGIPNHTDAIHYQPHSGLTFFFKVDNFYVYDTSTNGQKPYSIPTTSYFFDCRKHNF